MPRTAASVKGGFLGFSSSTSSIPNYGDYSMGIETSARSPFVTVLLYVLGIAIFLVLVLTVLHYTIMPIWKLTPGSKGVIALPGSDDTYKAWEKKPFQSLDMYLADPVAAGSSSLTTPLGSVMMNWSGTLDICIDDPARGIDNKYRILMYRGPIGTPSDGDTIRSQIPYFNFCIYLDKITNDLYISTLTKENNNAQPTIETAVINNPPTRKPLRIGWMLGERVLEVYLNGYLVKTLTLRFPLLAVSATSGIFPVSDTVYSNTARIQVLQLWARPLSAAEFRAIGQPSSFDKKDLLDTSICPG